MFYEMNVRILYIEVEGNWQEISDPECLGSIEAFFISPSSSFFFNTGRKSLIRNILYPLIEAFTFTVEWPNKQAHHFSVAYLQSAEVSQIV